MAPGADQRGQAGDRADCLAAAAAALDRDALADGGRLGRGKFACQRADVVGRDAGDRGDPFRRIVRRARLELVEAERVFLHVVVIDEILRDDHVHHAQRERAVGAGLMATCQSACLAVRVRTGSMTTILAPFFFASRMKGQACRLVLIMFMPHTMMYFA